MASLRNYNWSEASASSAYGCYRHEGIGIKEFYSKSKILVTGGTGFVGKVLIESLLRKTDVEKIYVIIRSKWNKTPQDRMNDLIYKHPLFMTLRSSSPERLSSITVLNGDVSLPDLGLSEEDRGKIIEEVEIIFHGAATVNFHDNLEKSTKINFKGTNTIMKLASLMKNLKVIMHISTVFCFIDLEEIHEKIYPTDEVMDIDRLDQTLDPSEKRYSDRRLTEKYINTYVLTKRLAEEMIAKEFSHLPVGIFRPSIVCSTVKEPVGGWIDNYLGATGISTAAYVGWAHVAWLNPTTHADIVPVDMLVNCLISAAPHTCCRLREVERKRQEVFVYNFVSSPEAPIKWCDWTKKVVHLGRESASKSTVWYPYVVTTDSRFSYRLATFFCHYIPSLVADIGAVVSGKKAQFVKKLQIYDQKMEDVSPFCFKHWNFKNDNVLSLWNKMDEAEKESFPFSFKEFNWDQYILVFTKGVKRYLLNDSSEEEDCRSRKNRLFYAHCSLVVLFLTIIAALVCYILYIIFYLLKPTA